MKLHRLLRACAPATLLTAAAVAIVTHTQQGSRSFAAELQTRIENTGDAARIVGRADSGRDVFRFETFGNEGFSTDAARVPQGMADSRVTPLEALKTGLLVDIDAVPTAMRDTMASELKTDLSARNAPTLNDPMATVKLIEAKAVVGIVAKDTNGDGRIDLAQGDKVGVSCAICHTITDKSIYENP